MWGVLHRTCAKLSSFILYFKILMFIYFSNIFQHLGTLVELQIVPCHFPCWCASYSMFIHEHLCILTTRRNYVFLMIPTVKCHYFPNVTCPSLLGAEGILISRLIRFVFGKFKWEEARSSISDVGVNHSAHIFTAVTLL